MLIQLEFNRYRCFDEHLIPMKKNSVIVGRNNAGKSTVIEGFRLLSIFSQRYPNLNFHQVPSWLDLPVRDRGMNANLSGLSISWESLFFNYSEPPACIKGLFKDGTSLSVYLGPNESVHAVVKDRLGNAVQSKDQARNLPLPALRVLPQVAPIAREEVVLNEDYVRANLSSYLAPLHFRNQLKYYYDEYFDRFKKLVESTWHGLQILELQGQHALPGEPLGLLVRDGTFVAELAWMGHGLQMWLQTMWFVARTPTEATVVLDEPDVYMHPDLQRKLARFLTGRFNQGIVATHSTEILSEVDADNILILERERGKSQYATNLPAVQKLLTDIGSVQNVSLMRLWNARRFLLVEGKDLYFFKRFHELVCPIAPVSLDVIPNMDIGGWGGWPYAVGSAMFLTNAAGENIMTYCLLDSDYHTPNQIQKRIDEATQRNVELHVWKKKEIENYLLNESLLHRVISKRTPTEMDPPTREQISQQLSLICEELYDQTIDGFAQEFLNDDRKRGVSGANKEARSRVEVAWQTLEGKKGIVSGKEVLSRLSVWAHENHGSSFGVGALLDEIRPEEVDDEVKNVLIAIENSRTFRGI